jgi:CHAT domain-containing protein
MRLGRLVQFSLGISLSVSCWAAPDEDVFAILREADRLADFFNWADALPLYEQAEKLFATAGDERNALHARFGRIRGSMEMLNLPETSDYLGQQLQSPLLQEDLQLRLMCLIIKGDIDGEIDTGPASADWQEVLAIATQLNDKHWQSRASAERGFQQFLQGDTASAMKAVGAGLVAAHEMSDVGAESRYLGAIGVALAWRESNDQAISYLDRAIDLARKHPDTGYPFIPIAGKVRALINKQDYEDALVLIAESEEQARKKNKEIKLAELLLSRADIAVAKRQSSDAIALLEQATELATHSQSRLVGECEMKLADAYRRGNDLQKAEEAAQKAVDATGQGRDMYYAPARLRTLAEVEERIGHVDKAADLYQRAADIIEGMLGSAPDNAARSALLTEMSPVFTSRFRLAAQRNNPSDAFRVIEQVRGRILANNLLQPTADCADRETEDKIRKLKIQLVRTGASRNRHGLMDQLFYAEQARWEKVLPGNSFRVVDPSTEINLKEVKNALRPNEVVLEYVLGEPESFCLKISRFEASIIKLPSRSRIEKLATGYTAQVKSGKEARSQAQSLYAVLIQPLRLAPNLTSLIIVPDGILHLVPFSALQDSTGKYVLTEQTVWYSPSGGTVAVLRRKNGADAPKILMAVGGVEYKTTASGSIVADAKRGVSRGDYYDIDLTKLDNLPGTDEEIHSAADALSADDPILKFGTDGTETQFKTTPLDQFRIIHLAVHGIANPKNPDRAALVFRPDPPQDDGLLEPREISNLHLNAELVVLSACETAVGPLQGEEGIANLSRTFLAAGARSVISTLWKIDDTYSLFLMKRFYSHLREGKPQAEALRLSQSDLLNKFGEDTAPVNWAAFTLLGDGDKVMFPSRRTEVSSR